jgi:hypothetical protein
MHSRILTVLTAASYLLAVSASALFHDHNDHHKDQPRPGESGSHISDGHDCSVCQFLAQKPAPIAEIAPVGSSARVQEVVALAPAHVVGGIFAAWHSRAPPVLA